MHSGSWVATAVKEGLLIKQMNYTRLIPLIDEQQQKALAPHLLFGLQSKHNYTLVRLIFMNV